VLLLPLPLHLPVLVLVLVVLLQLHHPQRLLPMVPTEQKVPNNLKLSNHNRMHRMELSRNRNKNLRWISRD